MVLTLIPVSNCINIKFDTLRFANAVFCFSYFKKIKRQKIVRSRDESYLLPHEYLTKRENYLKLYY